MSISAICKKFFDFPWNRHRSSCLSFIKANSLNPLHVGYLTGISLLNSGFINISGHKYGLCYPGIGWVIWRNRAAVPEDLIFRVNYLGGEMETFTLNFSRPASGVLSQAYNFLRLGREGYTACMTALKANADYLRERIETTEDFDIMSDNHSLPLVAWSVKESAPYTAFDLSDKLRDRGWIVPAYTMPKHARQRPLGACPNGTWRLAIRTAHDAR